MIKSLFKKNYIEKKQKMSRPASNGTRVLSSILIAFVVFANLFAPFSVGLGTKNNVEIQSNKAEAAPGDDDVAPVALYAEASKTDSTITIYAMPTFTEGSWWTASNQVTAFLFKSRSGTIDPKEIINGTQGINSYDLDDPEVSRVAKNFLTKFPDVKKIYKKTFTGLDPSTEYSVVVSAEQDYKSWTTKLQNYARVSYTISSLGLIQIFNSDGSIIELEGATKNKTDVTLDIRTSATGETTEVEAGNAQSANEAGMLPICALNNIGGCVGIVLYRLVFQPSSFLFALSGKAVDYTFSYSIKDSSYRSQFVVQGWGVVRDFCNLFFIFVLLYIAFGTILSLHNVKTKEMIINVVIIGLLINFSLFTTQVIIDASNILARVFYNSMTIGNKDSNDVVQEKVGAFGEKQISESIVKKVNPQQIIMKASEASNIKAKGVALSGDQDSGSIDNTTFIIVTILASIMNIVGLIVFFSVSLILITRVIGLWLAMIFVPLAFFTYIIPQAQDIDMVGWKKWWPETLKMAFLAPVFMFFIYLIVKFLETGLGVIDASTKTGTDFFIAVLVPFAFLMILLMKAKDIAKDMSGKMGQSITNGIAAAGGLALGGAALGAAFLGRKTLGSVSKYVQNDNARDKDAKTFGDYKNWSMGKKLNPFAYVGQAGKTAMAGVATGIHKIPAGTDAAGNKQSLGKRMKGSEKTLSEKNHADSVIASKMQEMHFDKDMKYKDLTEDEKIKVKASIDKDELAKFHFGKSFDKLDSDGSRDIQNRSDSGEKIVENDNGKKGSLVGTTVTFKDPTLGAVAYNANDHHNASDVIEHHASAKGLDLAVGEFSSALRKGSYDIRNISQLSAKSKGLPGMAVGLAAVVASGVRMGLKSGPGIEPGKGQKDFMKDLGETVKEALKGVKIEAPKSSGGGGGGGGHDAHKGGGGHH